MRESERHRERDRGRKVQQQQLQHYTHTHTLHWQQNKNPSESTVLKPHQEENTRTKILDFVECWIVKLCIWEHE